ncbi:hypothetical protein ES703_34568 [subsurface metagenome]
MKIKEIETIELLKALTPEVKKAYNVNGEEMNDIKFANLTDNLIEGLRRKFGLMEVDDVKIAMTNGIYGEYKQWDKVNVKNMLNWIRIKWDEIKQKKQWENDDFHREIADLRETPYGQAIIWKMRNIKIKDWDMIPLQNIAIAIKEGLNMQKFADDYNISLIKRKKSNH